MKKGVALIFVFAVCVLGAFAFTGAATVDGAKVWVVEYQLKKAQSAPMANAFVDKILDLSDGIGDSLSIPLNFEEVDDNAQELSITYDNTTFSLKAYAYDAGSTTYWYTSAAGIVSSLNDPDSEADYDFLELGSINRANSGDSIVYQSYFPDPAYIEADSVHVIHGLVNLEYSVLFWDGVDPKIGPFANSSSFYPDGVPAFAVAALDTILSLDTELTPEVYLFSGSSANLAAEDVENICAATLFFDPDGNLHDGAVKRGTGYSVIEGDMKSWARISGTQTELGGEIPFKVAKFYDASAGAYYFEITTSGFSRSVIGLEQTFTVTASGGPETVYYKRVQ